MKLGNAFVEAIPLPIPVQYPLSASGETPSRNRVAQTIAFPNRVWERGNLISWVSFLEACFGLDGSPRSPGAGLSLPSPGGRRLPRRKRHDGHRPPLQQRVDGYHGGKGTTVIDRRYRLQWYDGYHQCLGACCGVLCFTRSGDLQSIIYFNLRFNRVCLIFIYVMGLK